MTNSLSNGIQVIDGRRIDPPVFYHSQLEDILIDVIPLWYQESYLCNRLIDVYFIDPVTMKLYNDCEVSKKIIPFVEDCIKGVHSIKITFSRLQEV